jgi:hypothetical protein
MPATVKLHSPQSVAAATATAAIATAAVAANTNATTKQFGDKKRKG